MATATGVYDPALGMTYKTAKVLRKGKKFAAGVIVGVTWFKRRADGRNVFAATNRTGTKTEYYLPSELTEWSTKGTPDK